MRLDARALEGLYRSDARSASLALPSGAGYLIFSTEGPNGAVVAEVPRDATRRTLTLAPGRYFVRGRGADALFEGNVELARGTHKQIALSSFTRIDYARLVRKGDAKHVVVWGPALEIVGHTPWVEGGSFCHGAAVSLPFAFQFLTLAPRIAVCGGGWENAHVKARDLEASIAIDALHSFDLPFVSVEVGLDAGVMTLRQDFETSRKAPPRTSNGLVLGATGGVTVPLGLGVSASAAADVKSALLPLRDADGTPKLETPAVIGWRTGLSFSL